MTARPSWLADPGRYPYRPGSLFLGLDERGQEVGVSTERHAITIAGARAGKGACLLIPNALRWPHSLLAVDPKGENAEATWQARQALGQHVAVLDPFRVADVPDDLRATFNPLAAVDPSSHTAREDVRVVADGLVKRHKAEDEEWYAGAVSILAGVIAFVLEQPPPEGASFAAVRSVLLQEDAALFEDAQRMAQSAAFGGLAKSAGVAIQTAITSEKSMERAFLSGARRATDWMDSPAMVALLARSSFQLSDLKTGKLSLFLVLPPKYIEEHSTFLRLFVRLAIEAMMQEGVKSPGRCLMLLDEFYSLGRLDIISKSAGLMPGYGLHLWPFLQDLGQLRGLYGDLIADTFFSNADAALFFGNSDMPTLEFVSRRVGAVDPQEIGQAPTMGSGINPITGATVGALVAGTHPRNRAAGAVVGGAVGLFGAALHDMETRAKQAQMNDYQQKAMRVGRARLAPEQIAALTGRGQEDAVARAMLAFVKAGDTLMLALAPYFAARSPAAPSVPRSSRQAPNWYFVAFPFLAALAGYLSIANDGAPGDDPTAAAFAIFVLAAAVSGVAWAVRRARQRLARP